ncbi:MAG: hypothetical protein P8020_14465 [Acidobacteriota bacterium]
MWAHRGFRLSVILTSLVAFGTSALAGINSWTSTGPGGVVVYAIQALPDEVVLASVTCAHPGACSQGGVFRSTDGGQSWIRSDTGLHSDRGQSWQAESEGIPGGATVVSVLVDPAEPSRVFAGTDVGLHRSIDSGLRWTLASDDLPTTTWFTTLTAAPLPFSPASRLPASQGTSVRRSSRSVIRRWIRSSSSSI